MKIVYKVVSLRCAGEMKSFNQPLSNFALTYRVGYLTKPTIPYSLIFAFDTLQHARNFQTAYLLAPSAILKCKARLTTRKNLPNEVYQRLTDEAVVALWSRNPVVYSVGFEFLNDLPIGTVFCTQITPLEIIK